MYTSQTPPDTLRILLAEDCKDSREIFYEVLKRTGAEITCVSNGKECLDLALDETNNSKTFDLIIMDVQMPVMDGHTASRAIRKKGLNIPIISMTARSLPEDERESERAGCNSHISKLCGMKGLLGAVEKELSVIKKTS
jgi:CheY-like chemotaxis protein